MHLNKTSCKIWSIFDEVHFWVKNLTPFFHRSLHLTSYSILFESTINSEIPGSLIQFCIGAVVCAVCLGGREDAQKLNLTANCLNTFVTHYSNKTADCPQRWNGPWKTNNCCYANWRRLDSPTPKKCRDWKPQKPSKMQKCSQIPTNPSCSLWLTILHYILKLHLVYIYPTMHTTPLQHQPTRQDSFVN